MLSNGKKGFIKIEQQGGAVKRTKKQTPVARLAAQIGGATTTTTMTSSVPITATTSFAPGQCANICMPTNCCGQLTGDCTVDLQGTVQQLLQYQTQIQGSCQCTGLTVSISGMSSVINDLTQAANCIVSQVLASGGPPSQTLAVNAYANIITNPQDLSNLLSTIQCVQQQITTLQQLQSIINSIMNSIQAINNCSFVKGLLSAITYTLLFTADNKSYYTSSSDTGAYKVIYNSNNQPVLTSVALGGVPAGSYLFVNTGSTPMTLGLISGATLATPSSYQNPTNFVLLSTMGGTFTYTLVSNSGLVNTSSQAAPTGTWTTLATANLTNY